MAGFQSMDALSIAGKMLIPGFGPGNSGTSTEILVYSAGADGFGFLEMPRAEANDIIFTTHFNNLPNDNVITSETGSGGSTMTYATNGGLVLTTGTTAGDGASAKFSIAGSYNWESLEQLVFSFTNGGNYDSGALEIAIGVTDATTLPTNATTTKGIWFYLTVTAGTPTAYICAANGSAVTATDVTADFGALDSFKMMSIVATNDGADLSSVSFYKGMAGVSDELLGSITTNLPGSGQITNSQLWRVWIETNDTTARVMTPYHAKISFGS